MIHAPKFSPFNITDRHSLFKKSQVENGCGPALKLGRIIRVNQVTFCLGQTRFKNYPGLTQIGSRAMQNYELSDMEVQRY